MSKKILLADDSITIHKVISITFADEDFDLKIVSDGDSAVAEARKFAPDLVMADVSMPGKSGYEVCESIKSDPRLSHTPVLILAGTFEPIDAEELKRVGADDCIVKPFESQELIDKVQNLLEKNIIPHPTADGALDETGFSSEESGIPAVEEAPEESSEPWDERDFIIAETVEERAQPVELSGDDTLGGVTAEEVGEELEKEELRKIVAEEFEELDLGGGDVETIEELEEIKEVEELLEDEDEGSSLSEEEPTAFEPAAGESDTIAEGDSFDEGGAVETLISEPDSEAEVDEAPQEGDELSPPWLSDVTDEDGMALSGVDVASDDEVTEELVTEEAAQPDLTCALEPEEEIEAPSEEGNDEAATQPDGEEDRGEADDEGTIDRGVSFDIPPAELDASEEPPTFETAAPDLDETHESQPVVTAASDDEAVEELPEPFEMPESEPEVEEEPAVDVEAGEPAPEAPPEEVEEYGGEETEAEGDGASEVEPEETHMGFEAVTPSGDEVETPLDVEAEEGLSCAVAEPEPQPEATGLPEDGIDEETAYISPPVIEPEEPEMGENEEEDEEEVAAPPETIAAHTMDKDKLEEIVARVARSVLEEVAWEVVPEMVAEMVKEEIRRSREAATDRE